MGDREKLLRKLKWANTKLFGFHYEIGRHREKLKVLRRKRNEMQGRVNDLEAALGTLEPRN